MDENCFHTVISWSNLENRCEIIKCINCDTWNVNICTLYPNTKTDACQVLHMEKTSWHFQVRPEIPDISSSNDSRHSFVVESLLKLNLSQNLDLIKRRGRHVDRGVQPFEKEKWCVRSSAYIFFWVSCMKKKKAKENRKTKIRTIPWQLVGQRQWCLCESVLPRQPFEHLPLCTFSACPPQIPHFSLHLLPSSTPSSVLEFNLGLNLALTALSSCKSQAQTEQSESHSLRPGNEILDPNVTPRFLLWGSVGSCQSKIP